MAKNSRHGARKMLVQALYQMQISEHTLGDIADQFADHPQAASADTEYFSRLLSLVKQHQAQLDSDIGCYGDIPAAQIDPVEKAVLWLALAELRECADVPRNVVINEAVEMAKLFGAEGGHRYVNGVLDKAATALR